MAGRLFQNIINQMQDALLNETGVIDSNNIVLACTDSKAVGKVFPVDIPMEKFPDFNEESKYVHIGGYTFKSFFDGANDRFFVYCAGSDNVAKTCCGILTVALGQLKVYYDEKYDKISFMKNLLADNIMTGDIYFKAKSLHLSLDVTRVVFVVRDNADEYLSYEIIAGLFPEKTKDFVINVTPHNVVLVKEVRPEITPKELDKIARTIADTLSSEIMETVQIGVGSVAQSITEIANSYKDACVALEVVKVFDQDRTVISYNNLGIARLIYQLPTKLCEIFLSEVFRKNSLDILDEETIVTIQRFFDNNLNVSEAARKLFVHRNTLVYRLDKILKLTGLDLRKFDDAIVFKVAMMVSRYLKSGNVDL